MPEQDLNLKTDVALIQKDLKQIERFFAKFDTALSSMADLSKHVAVQGEILKSQAEKLQSLEMKITEHKLDDIERAKMLSDRLEEHRKSAYADHERLAKESQLNRKERNEEIMTQLSKMNGAIDAKLTKLDERIVTLEQWKLCIMGLCAVIVFVLSNVPWPAFFG